LITLGYAWAASSYDRNDYDIASGVKSSHALLKRFNGLVGKPSRIYMTGASMGGHITAVAIEQYPTTFDGALPICGVLGDYALFDYFMDFNSAAQQLGTGNSQYPLDPAQYIGLTVPAIKAGLEAAPGAWPFFLNTDGENLENLTELCSGGERCTCTAARVCLFDALCSSPRHAGRTHWPWLPALGRDQGYPVAGWCQS
jgi:hypothetical protein